MASKSEALSTKDIEELLDTVDMTMERLKTLYEQYFMGLQKQAPAFIHSDVERKLRDLTQLNVRNTGLRYRLATLQQKFGSYNSYWRRTLRQIENGTYLRQLAKVGREAAKNGTEIPEEILAAMPKRMREQVIRDRDNAIAIAKRRNQMAESDVSDDGASATAAEMAAPTTEVPAVRRDPKTTSGAHLLSEDDGDLDFDQLFAAFQDDAPPAAAAAPPPRPQVPAHAKIEPAQTQKITMPVPRFAKPGSTPASDDARTQALPRFPTPPPPDPSLETGPVPIVTPPTETSVLPRFTSPTTSPVDEAKTTALPRIPTGAAAPRQPTPPPGARMPTPSTGAPPRQPTPPPGARAPTPSAGTPPRPPTPPPGQRLPQRAPTPPPGSLKPPPGMTEADVNALHAKYVQAKQAVGEKVDASSRDKLLRTISQTAPKVMEQYKSAGVDFTVVVKDNQVVIKAKPKG